MSLSRLGGGLMFWGRRKKLRKVILGKAVFDRFEMHVLTWSGVGLGYLGVVEQVSLGSLKE
jgi:hypothetical protein